MSRDIADIRREYDRLDALCGADTSALELRVSTRMTSTLGHCAYRGNAPVRVTIASFVMDGGNDALFLDTVRHEYAHALVKLRFPRENHGHDAVWKAACREVGCAPERCCRDPEVVAAGKARRRALARYLLRCEGCGAEFLYARRSKAVRLVETGRGRSCACPFCKGRSFTLTAVS